MNKKKEKIIEVSMKLFAEKGFHATSISEIARTANVSKGAFYLYFESKDDLLISIFEFYTRVIIEKLEKVIDTESDPFKQFERQLEEIMTLFRDHKEYLLMHFRDNIHIGDKMDGLVAKVHKQTFDWTTERVLAMYGDKVKPYIVDVTIQLDGLVGSYFKWIAIHKLEFDPKYLAKNILQQFDILVQKQIEANEEPLFHIQTLQFDCSNVHTQLEKIRTKIKRSNLENKLELLDAVIVIEEELQKMHPKMIIVYSMIEKLEQEEAIATQIKSIKQKIEERGQY
jgi:AcrR family transcriptional regulator